MSQKISLIIPAYNEEKYIGECLKSAVRSAQGKFCEIIVIDNASTDKTAEIASRVPGVRVVSEEKKGLTRARERGFREARGEILAYVDADTRMPRGWVEQIETAFQDKKLVALSGPYLYYDMGIIRQSLVRLYWLFLGMPTYWITGYMVVGGNFAIRRSVLERMKGFDTSIEFYGEDTNIARRASAFGTVRFSLSFLMETSGRRLAKEGFFKIGYIYVVNFLSEVIRKKPADTTYTDIR